MKKVVIESPLSPSNGRTFAQNIRYAKLCCLDALKRGEAPYASHLLLTQFLDDATPEERLLGMQVGFVWGECADLAAVYVDYGVSSGMRQGIALHEKNGIPVETRTLPPEVLGQVDKNVSDIHETEGMSKKSV